MLSERVAPQSEVFRAVVLEDSRCCEGPCTLPDRPTSLPNWHHCEGTKEMMRGHQRDDARAPKR